jgi:hypothetical protein
MNKNSKQSVHAGEESSKASATNPSLTQTMVRIILHPIYSAFIEPDPLSAFMLTLLLLCRPMDPNKPYPENPR